IEDDHAIAPRRRTPMRVCDRSDDGPHAASPFGGDSCVLVDRSRPRAALEVGEAPSQWNLDLGARGQAGDPAGGRAQGLLDADDRISRQELADLAPPRSIDI